MNDHKDGVVDQVEEGGIICRICHEGNDNGNNVAVRVLISPWYAVRSLVN
jgi:hypothetical protein